MPPRPNGSAVEADEEDESRGVHTLVLTDPGGDSVVPQASWMDVRFTTTYVASPSGNYRRHLVVCEVEY